jgi:zinc transport system ATP-binding protein
MTGEVAVEFSGVSFAYPGSAMRAVEGISLRVEAGEMLAIVGPNGGGKSTLLKIMLGLLHGYTGNARVFGRTPDEARREGIVGYVPQRSGAALDFPVSARQAALMSATARISGLQATPRAAREAVDESLRRVGAAEFADRPVGTLSGGQLQRVFIARALACRPKILALDEPLVGVDAAGQQRFGELLAELRRELGLTILLVSHDLRTIAGGARARVAGQPMCDRVACLRRTLHFHAAPEKGDGRG